MWKRECVCICAVGASSWVCCLSAFSQRGLGLVSSVMAEPVSLSHTHHPHNWPIYCIAHSPSAPPKSTQSLPVSHTTPTNRTSGPTLLQLTVTTSNWWCQAHTADRTRGQVRHLYSIYIARIYNILELPDTIWDCFRIRNVREISWLTWWPCLLCEISPHLSNASGKVKYYFEAYGIM